MQSYQVGKGVRVERPAPLSDLEAMALCAGETV